VPSCGLLPFFLANGWVAALVVNGWRCILVSEELSERFQFPKAFHDLQ
jgi:hypothetical protein